MAMQDINYDHALNSHGLEGPEKAMPIVLEGQNIQSLLDVGCGTGTWMRAALRVGIRRVHGVDGVLAKDEQLHVPGTLMQRINFEMPFDLGQKFDAILCLEVAEHLSSSAAAEFVGSICRHGDLVFFSAACPGQPGKHHINCQWPAYWQSLFNRQGFVCDDNVRWRLWGMSDVEPWYKQNMFIAQRSEKIAGREPRIPAVIHPEMAEYFRYEIEKDTLRKNTNLIDEGLMPIHWYLSSALHGIARKLARKAGL